MKRYIKRICSVQKSKAMIYLRLFIPSIGSKILWMHLSKQKRCLPVNETDSLPPMFDSTAIHALSAVDAARAE